MKQHRVLLPGPGHQSPGVTDTDRRCRPEADHINRLDQCRYHRGQMLTTGALDHEHPTQPQPDLIGRHQPKILEPNAGHPTIAVTRSTSSARSNIGGNTGLTAQRGTDQGHGQRPAPMTGHPDRPTQLQPARGEQWVQRTWNRQKLPVGHGDRGELLIDKRRCVENSSPARHHRSSLSNICSIDQNRSRITTSRPERPDRPDPTRTVPYDRRPDLEAAEGDRT